MNKGRSFEFKVADAFKRKGFRIEVTPQSRDHGIDILMSKHGKLTGVECKNFKRGSRVGREIIQKFDSALNHNPYSDSPLDYGFVVTTSEFTADAKNVVELMNSHYGYARIKLIDGDNFRRNYAGYSNGRSFFRRFSEKYSARMSFKTKLILIAVAAALLMCIMNGIADGVKFTLSYLSGLM